MHERRVEIRWRDMDAYGHVNNAVYLTYLEWARDEWIQGVLGSVTDADDAVQDAWLRVSRADTAAVENLDAWLTTVVARVCLNMLRSRAHRREESLDVHVPDPLISRAEGVDPEQQALLADWVGLALFVVLDTLAPAERLAFVLHDMFGVPFDEIAPMIERTPTAARQLASRARRRVRGQAPAPDPDLARQRTVVDAFFAAQRRRPGEFWPEADLGETQSAELHVVAEAS